METKPRGKVEITYCAPGNAIGYRTDFEYTETFIVETTVNTELNNYARLWVAVIRECLNDVINNSNITGLKDQKLESFNWLFRDKRTFPAVAEMLGYETVHLRKRLIKFVRSQREGKNFIVAKSIYSDNLIKKGDYMAELESLSYNALQKLAKAKGIKCNGMTKDKIIESIQLLSVAALTGAAIGPSLEEQFDKAEANAISKSKASDLVAAPKPRIITDINQIHESAPRSMKIAMEAQNIIDHCNEIFAKSFYKSCKARLSDSGEGIDFIGGARQVQWVTLHQPAKTIYYYAQVFASKAVVEKTKVNENGEETFISEIR